MLKPAIILLSTAFLPTVAFPQSIRVDITPGHSTNAFTPLTAIGAGVDGVGSGVIDHVYTPENIRHMLSAGFGTLTYRLYTELSVQHWHWNNTGSFSEPAGQGYWTGSSASPAPITHSRGYNLPRSGFTTDQGSNSGYSRLDDGDPATFWKSNPYLSNAFTHETDSAHPQWVLIDLGSPKPINAVQLNWANPYAIDYQIQYWTGPDPFYDQANGDWITFPSGTVTGGTGGVLTLGIAPQPISVEFFRVWMTASSGTCTVNPALDPRDCAGYALNEVGVGTLDANGTFTDLLIHRPDQGQTLTSCSSVDPWHRETDQEQYEEQPGLDLVFTSGLTRGLPAVVPVSLLYGVPQDSANQLAYLKSKGYPIGYVEMGEEADGQFMLPEDYGALYLQWADAIHAVDATLKLGGPVLEADQEVTAWADANGNTSWVNRFLKYLNAHGRLADLAFFSYEHYPYEPCSIAWESLLQEPAFTKSSLETWAADGLPANVPVLVTESNVTYDFQQEQVDLFGALWFSDFTGVFLTLGGKQVYFYEYEPLPLYRSSSCNSWGNFGMFRATDTSSVEGYTSQYFSARMLTQQWTEPVNAAHYTFPTYSSVRASTGAALVTAYTVLRPDGRWSLLLINKDKNQPQTVNVSFHDAATRSDRFFAAPVTQAVFGPDQYIWHPAGAHGFALPDGPIDISTQRGGPNASYTLPAASITVLRGYVR